MRSFVVTIITIVTLSTGVLANSSDTYTVSYVSAEHVYVDGGRAEGLAVGDLLSKSTKGDVVTKLEIIYVALHSASCRTIEGTQTLVAGDVLTPLEKRAGTENATTDPDKLEPAIEAPSVVASAPILAPTSVPVRIFGNASMIFYHWQDKSDANLDFTQTSARLNLRAENIWREHLTFAVRTRGRYDVRNRAYSAGISESDWENRLWVLSLEYDDPKAPLAFTVGRFLPRRLGNIGYIDGASARAKVSNRIHVGAFAGRQPKWGYNEDAPALSKYGGYFTYRTEGRVDWYFDQSVGMISEFFESNLNRSFLAWSGSLRHKASWGVSQSIELDVNRGWRQDKAGGSLTLSNLFLHSWIRLNRAARVSLQYDNRQNYWTYQYLSRADSLFDSRVRQGLRGRIDLTPISRTWMSASVGYRKAAGDEDPSISYSGSVRRSRFFGYELSISLRWSGFDGIYENGNNYSIRADLPAGAMGSPYVSYGGYEYSVDNQDGSRSSNDIEIGTRFDFIQGYYIGGSGEWSTGDDIDGLRIQIELGFRY